MTVNEKSLLGLTAGDVMKGPVEVIPRGMTLDAAARRLRRAQVSGAPVVDEAGRCVGVLSATDFIRWADEGATQRPGTSPRIRTCLFQKEVRGGDDRAGVLCTLADGSCPLQVEGAGIDGREALFCLLPHCFVLDWQQVVEGTIADAVSQYMTADVVTVSPATPLTVVARMMIDAHIHRVLVVDEERRPVGIVTTTDLLAALAERAPPR
jgi:CBS domain-containing protein